MLPGLLVATGACARQRKVREVESVEMTLEFPAGRSSAAERPMHTRLERLQKHVGRERPAAGIRLAIETIEERTIDHSAKHML
jgi:hypothetical protein